MHKTTKSPLPRWWNPIRSGFWLFLAFSLTFTFATTVLLSNGRAAIGGDAAADSSQETISMEEQWGVTVEGLRTSANGHLLDFRYRIKDADKALPLVDRTNKAYLIDQATGKVLAVPNTAKVGPLRQTVRYGKPKEDRVYFILFGNPGLVKPGAKVTVVIGDFRAEDIVVQ